MMSRRLGGGRGGRCIKEAPKTEVAVSWQNSRGTPPTHGAGRRKQGSPAWSNLADLPRLHKTTGAPGGNCSQQEKSSPTATQCSNQPIRAKGGGRCMRYFALLIGLSALLTTAMF